MNLLDNKIILSLGGIVLLAPAAPFLVLMLIGLCVIVWGFYWISK
jgi:hypothetical protein